MKSIILIIIFVLLLPFTNNTLIAQVIPTCDQGWNSSFLSTSIEIAPGVFCDVTIFYCWRDINGEREIRIRAVGFVDKYCLEGHDVSSPSMWLEFVSVVLRFQANLPSGDPQKINPGPCPGGSIYTNARKKACWKWINGTVNTTLVGCEDEEGVCYTRYRVCWNYNTSPTKLEIYPVSQEPVGALCEEIPPVIYDPDIEESVCWINCASF